MATRYFLVHDDDLVGVRSGHGLAEYDTVAQARKYQSHHTTNYVKDDQGNYVRGPEVTARIMELSIEGDTLNARWVQ